MKVHSYSPADNELRSKNLATVLEYMLLKGQERLTRARFFVPGNEATAGNGYGVGCEERYMTGIDDIRKADEFNAKTWPDWGFDNIQIYETGDPNFFWVDSTGSGLSKLPGHEPREYGGRYLHSFVMRDGLILHYREWRNPCVEYITFGYEMPKLLVSKEALTNGQ